jgi:hypothetical protein
VRRLLLRRRRLLQEGKWGVLCWGNEWNEEGRERGEKGEAPRRARLLPFPLLRCVARLAARPTPVWGWLSPSAAAAAAAAVVVGVGVWQCAS